MTVTVLGAGSWGTALTLILSRNGHDVLLVDRDQEHIDSLYSVRENMRYLPGFALPMEVRYSTDIADGKGCDLWVVAVPSSAVRNVISHIPEQRPFVVIASKGLEPGSTKRISEVVQDEFPEAAFGVLSGPNLAVELARGIPTAAVAASAVEQHAKHIQSTFACSTYRVFISEDVAGVELGGALKNVLAIGAGVSDGLGFGDNTKGALLARGLIEMARVGQVLGARAETFLDVAGVGDLFATANSKLSRNYRVGFAIGEGKTLKDALEDVGQVAEGVPTSEATMAIVRRHQLHTPVFEAIEAVLRGRLLPREAVSLLMERLPRQTG